MPRVSSQGEYDKVQNDKVCLSVILKANNYIGMARNHERSS